MSLKLTVHGSRALAPAAALALALLASSPAAWADIIYLKNGNQIQGEIQKRGDQAVVIKFPGGTLSIPTRDILRVESESRFQYLLAEAERHMSREDYQGAGDFFQAALKEKAGAEPALDGMLRAKSSLGRQLFESRRLDEAIEAYKSVLKSQPRNTAAQEAIDAIRKEIEAANAEEAKGLDELREGKFGPGFDRLVRVYERFPDRHARLAPFLGNASLALGHTEYRSGRFETAETRYLEALEYQPDLVYQVAIPYVNIKIRQFQPLVSASQFENLLKSTDEALEIVPSSSVLHYFRGLALEGLGRPEDARPIYRRLINGKPVRAGKNEVELLRQAAEAEIVASLKPAAASEPELPRKGPLEILPGEFHELATDHFVIFHHNNAVGSEVAQVAEEVYQRLFQDLGLKTHWQKACRILLHSTQEDFVHSTGRHNWTGGSHQIYKRLGALADHRIDSYLSQPRLTSCIIPHEIAHAMLAHRLRYLGELPLWLNEGFAIHSEPAFIHRHYQAIVLQALRIDKLVRVGDLAAMKDYPPDDQVKLFYAMSYSLTSYLIEDQGMEVFLKFAEAVSLETQSLDAALKRYYKIDTARALETLWISDLNSRR